MCMISGKCSLIHNELSRPLSIVPCACSTLAPRPHTSWQGADVNSLTHKDPNLGAGGKQGTDEVERPTC